MATPLRLTRPSARSSSRAFEIVWHVAEDVKDSRVFRVAEIGIVDEGQRHRSGVRLVASQRVRTPDHG
jgi:hypothetical protein